MGEKKVSITRRQFIKYGMCGLTAVAASPWKWPGMFEAQAQVPSFTVNLSMEAADVEMVDGTLVFHWVFQLQGAPLPSFPGPLIFVFTGDNVTINITNNLDEPHEFRIPGAGPGGADIVSTPQVIAANGGTAVVNFTPGVAGTFMYLDSRNAPVNRVLGLHGAFIVLPAEARTADPAAKPPVAITPYTPPTAQVQNLFNDLGVAADFPGDRWFPVRPANVPAIPDLVEAAGEALEPFLFRTRIWLFHTIDPALNARAAAGQNAEPGGGIDPATVIANFLPRYFTLNGETGVFSSHNHATLLEGFIGEPHLVRILNAGLANHSEHIHANHFFILAVNGVVQESAFMGDSMTLRTVEGDPVAIPATAPPTGNQFLFSGSRVDWLTPFIRPPDIPGPENVPLRDLIPEELALVVGDVPQSPLKYPMHDHMEQSQTAAGGNYPQGNITDFIFLGDLDKVPFPHANVPGPVPPPPPPPDRRALRQARRAALREARRLRRAAQRPPR